MIGIQRVGENGVAPNVNFEATKTMSRATSSTRMPLQPRNPNSLPQSLSGSSDGSLHKESAANRLSTLESSNNENNRARINSSGRSSNNSVGYPVEIGSDTGDASLITHTGTHVIRHSVPLQRSLSAGNNILPNKPAEPPPSTLSASTSQIETDENVMLEEKRRKANGDGYTIHRYLRGRMLGKGGFAKVYMCTALDTNKNYAVKVVPKANLVKTRARQKLQTEIKIHRTLKHKHICEYKHFFEDRNNCYILLELCHNQSMNEMIRRRKRLTEPEAAYYVLQMVEAVEYMHQNCVIHRDLKLGNLFLDKDLTIKVGDLGLATKLETTEEKRKTICGTPNYIAPEVIQGTKDTRGHSFEVDIWSMGVILYTLIVGKPPYEAKDVKATYQRIISNQYSFPSHIPVSDDAKDLISLMLQSKPEDRPTLLHIKCHPFFTSDDAMVPTSLPLKVLHVSPEWHRNELGEVVVSENIPTHNESTYRKSAHVALPRPSGVATRRCFPFNARDPNADLRMDDHKPEKRDSEAPELLQRLPSKASTISAVVGKSTAPSAFAIFDENDKVKPVQPQSRAPSVEDIITKAGALSLLDRKVGAEVTEHLTSPRAGDQDSAILLQMLERLTTVLDIAESRLNGYHGTSPQATSRGGPKTWVTRYVDYTSKYGLGFLLNDGCSGVYFNDSTKAVLEGEGDRFEYIERRKVETKEGGRRNEPTCEKHTLHAYPESLDKKVTLLKHFRNYLIEQQQKADDDSVSILESFNAKVPDSLVYLKKWVRTKHAILFRLSTQTVQIVFYDQTEILLTPDERFVTYVDKQRHRSTFYLNDELVGTNLELAKRIKYSKEILQQLLVGQQRARAGV